MTYPKRLIEVDLPIKRISAHARREKSIRHGHISTLHIWWARRPLAACRAVICASLWPDPADVNCPQAFRDAALKSITEFAKASQSNKWGAAICDGGSWQRYMRLAHGQDVDPKTLKGQIKLRALLLDFIADFAAWEASTNRWFIDTACSLTQAAHESVGGQKGTRPVVVDPFAGGGAIPLEALRVGADAFASDLNPVAVLLNKIVLEYIPKYGQELADDLRKWGKWLRERAEEELDALYPKDDRGATPVAYLWARVIQCEGPGCGVGIPLIRAPLFSKGSPGWQFSISPEDESIHVKIEKGTVARSSPSVSAGKAVCPMPECGYATPAKSVRTQLIAKRGGAHDARLLAVLRERDGVRTFEEPNSTDLSAIELAARRYSRDEFPSDKINTMRPHQNTRGLSAVTRIGIAEFQDLYTQRQAITLKTILSVVDRVDDRSWSDEYRLAVRTLLHCAASRLVFQNCSLSRWHAGRDTIEGAFGKQALQNTWDFAESNPISNGPASLAGAVEWVSKVIESQLVVGRTGNAERAKAQESLLPQDAADALITDPPYFAAIPYGDLSDVFYVWEREFIKKHYPGWYTGLLTNKDEELIVTNCQRGASGETKDAEFFRREMTIALKSQRVVVRPSGVAVIVFADSKTAAWEAMLGAAIDAGWVVTGSWPIDTELQNRTQASGSASLQSSVHLVCRPREDGEGQLQENIVGDWREVLAELPKRIREWMARLSSEGVVGADAIFACLGPALEIFSRFSRVEKASGEQVKLTEYLTYVWGAVAQEALAQIFKEADATGFEEDARLTAMWLWTLNAGAPTNVSAAEASGAEPEETSDEDEESPSSGGKTSGYALEFDAARKIAQGLGAHLEDLSGVVEIKGETARLLSVSERTRRLFGKDEAEAPQPKRKKKDKQMKLFSLEEVESEEGGWGDKSVPKLGDTVLDRIHQSMILFAAGRGEALRRFLVEDGAGQDQRFWKLANALSALYPQGTDEKRWVDGVLARKKGLGL